MRACAARSASITDTMGRVKSITACAAASKGKGSAVSLMPLGCNPASAPASMPRSGWPSASSAPVKVTPEPWAISRTRARPMRPEAPATTIFRSAMRSDFRIHRVAHSFAPRHRYHGRAQQPGRRS